MDACYEYSFLEEQNRLALLSLWFEHMCLDVMVLSTEHLVELEEPAELEEMVELAKLVGCEHSQYIS